MEQYKPSIKREIVMDNEEFQLTLVCSFAQPSNERMHIYPLSENEYILYLFSREDAYSFIPQKRLLITLNGSEYSINPYEEEKNNHPEIPQYTEEDFAVDFSEFDEVRICCQVAIVTKVIDGIPYDGMIDVNGRELLPPCFTLSVPPVNYWDINDESHIQFRHNGLVGIMNLRQEILVEPKFTSFDSFHDDTIQAVLGNGNSSQHNSYLLSRNGTEIFKTAGDDEYVLSVLDMIVSLRGDKLSIYKIVYKDDYHPTRRHYSDLGPFNDEYANVLRKNHEIHLMMQQYMKNRKRYLFED